jgi:hypothetical protein
MTGKKNVMFEMKKKTTTPKSKEMFKLIRFVKIIVGQRRKIIHIFSNYTKKHMDQLIHISFERLFIVGVATLALKSFNYIHKRQMQILVENLKQIHNGLNVQKSLSNSNCKLQTWDIQQQKVNLKSEYELGNYLVFLCSNDATYCYHVDIRC